MQQGYIFGAICVFLLIAAMVVFKYQLMQQLLWESQPQPAVEQTMPVLKTGSQVPADTTMKKADTTVTNPGKMTEKQSVTSTDNKGTDTTKK